jgi:valyl-tRNA synthetase
MDQWFIDVNKPIASRGGKSLKELMSDAVRGGEVEILPERFTKTYFHWIDNLRDWNISRQIWFGHRVPVWNCIRCQAAHTNKKIVSRWYFVRHGETEANVAKIHQGHGDSPLTALGREQAEKMAESFKGKEIGLILSSDLGRARETAEAVAKITGAEIVYDEAFRERNAGDMQGLSHEDAKKRFGDHKDHTNIIPNAETYEEMETRIMNAYHAHHAEHGNQNVVIVSHSGTVRMLKKALRGLSFEEALVLPGAGNAEVVSFDVSEEECACGGNLFEQESDTLDTWFSSGLWTFSTLGWPNQDAKDLKEFHPTTVLETGYDILFFWVARMILMSTYLLGEVPFKTVYLHGLVRDEQGRKMSKSLGNIINPLDMIDQYGADATRLSLLVGSTPGNDVKLSEEKIAGFRNFTNKLWNISRFVFMSVDEVRSIETMPEPATSADASLLHLLTEVTKKATEHYARHEFSAVGELLREFTWSEFADWYVEIAKTQMSPRTQEILLYTLEAILKLWHPFMPFVTEALYKEFNAGLLAVAPWPAANYQAKPEDLEAYKRLQAVVTFARNIRAQYGIAYSLPITIECESALLDDQALEAVKMLVKAGAITQSGAFTEGQSAVDVVAGVKVQIPLSGLVDFEAEKNRLHKELGKLEGYVKSLESQLANEGFLANATPEVVEARKASLKEAQQTYETLKTEYESL